MSQPIIDECILGYRRQFPGQVSVDVAGIYRKIHNMFAQTDINGIYPSGPNQPFGGFGLVDPNQGIVYRLTNNDWSAMHYHALQITVAKNLSHNFQAMAAIHQQWQHDSGTWNPTDPARFIQPDAFPNNRMLWRTRDPNDHNSYPGSTTAPMWNPFSYRFNGTWHAPAGIVVGGQLLGRLGRVELVDRQPTRGQRPAARGVRTRDGDLVDRIGAVQSAHHPMADQREHAAPPTLLLRWGRIQAFLCDPPTFYAFDAGVGGLDGGEQVFVDLPRVGQDDHVGDRGAGAFQLGLLQKRIEGTVAEIEAEPQLGRVQRECREFGGRANER